MTSRAITLFHLSDIHFGLEDREALEWVERCIADERPDVVAITGDLTMRARHREYAAACDWVEMLGVPVMVDVGNHDMPYFNLVERLADPFRRFAGIKDRVERDVDLGDLAIVPLRTTAPAQWRWPWVDGWITEQSLEETLAMIDALPSGARVVVTAHHPLPERSETGKLLTRGGTQALTELARRDVLAVLSGHVHDPFDLTEETPAGPVRMIGAGTLSLRLRSTPPSFNEIRIGGREVSAKVRNVEKIPTPEMQVDAVPEGKLPPVDQPAQ